MKTLFSLEGKNAWITGASYGIGFNIAKAFAEAGIKNIIFNDINEDALAKGLANYKEAGIENVHGYVCDVTNEDAVKELVEKVHAEVGQIDILVNNAGTGAVGPAEEITDEQFKHEMNIDLFGTFACAREFGKEMIKAKYGRIINSASMYGLVGNMIVGSAPYHAAKGGVVNFTRALAAEWGKYGITVNSICPGYFYTDLTTETLDSDYFQAIAKRSIPLERYGRSGELDTCALFLASPASTYVTGQNIAVDGGYTCV